MTLHNLAALPAVGDILLGTGETPLGGRVVAVAVNGDEATVTLELVGLEAMFDQLKIDQRIPLAQAPLSVPAEVTDLFDTQRLADGTLVLTPRPTQRRGGAVGTVATPLCQTTTTNLLQIFTLNVGDAISITPNLTFEIAYDFFAGGLQRLVVSGSPTALFELRPRTTAAFEGKIVCNLQLAELTIPVGGPLALILSGKIPLGVGVEVSGKVSTTTPAGYDLTVTGNADFASGVRCLPECEVVAELDASFGGAARPVLPSVDVFLGDYQVDIGGYAYVFAEFGVGALLGALSFKPFSVKAGFKQSGSFRSITSQANSTAAAPFGSGASAFKLEGVGTAGASNVVCIANYNLARKF